MILIMASTSQGFSRCTQPWLCICPVPIVVSWPWFLGHAWSVHTFSRRVIRIVPPPDADSSCTWGSTHRQPHQTIQTWTRLHFGWISDFCRGCTKSTICPISKRLTFWHIKIPRDEPLKTTSRTWSTPSRLLQFLKCCLRTHLNLGWYSPLWGYCQWLLGRDKGWVWIFFDHLDKYQYWATT